MGIEWIWAWAAGACAAGSAVMAKIASPLALIRGCDNCSFLTKWRFLHQRWEYKVVCYAGLVLCNVIMWSLHVRSLKALTSVQATVLNFASNFLLSGLAGFILFNEPAHPQWFVGATFIVLGIWFVSNATKEVTDDSSKKD